MRICALGAYGRRRDWPGFPWDGQYQAWNELRHDTMLVDIPRWRTYKHFLQSSEYYENLRDRILAFEPDLLWIDLKDGLPVLIKLVEDTGRRNFRTFYWFRDLRAPEGTDSPVPVKPPTIDPERVHGLIDCMCMTSGGEVLQQHQRAYSIPRTCFMPTMIVPEIMCHRDVPKTHDIVFAGSMNTLMWHRGRTKVIERMSERFSVTVRSNAFRDLPEFNSSGKIVFGADFLDLGPAFNALYYTSARFWLSLACGSCYVCQWFPGIERLAHNHEHLVWWKDERELYEVIDYYLAHDEHRKRIGRNAQALAHDKHTHVKRVQNILDFVEGKVDDFQGFI